MADLFKYVQAQNFSLAGSGAVAGATTIVLKSFTGIDEALLTMTDFGAIGFATIEPGNGTQEEQISFTGVTQNANGTATLTGVSSVLFISPYTASGGLAKTHPGSAVLIISNTSGYYNKFAALANDETITGLWTFPTGASYPTIGTVYSAPSSDLEIATKKYVDDVAISGAPDATLTVKGIVEIATTAEIDAGTATGGTGASIVVRPDQLVLSIYGTRLPTTGQKSALVGNNTDIAVGSGNLYVTQTGLQDAAELYAASAAGSDTYEITLSPVPTAYHNGMTLRFKADVANTGAATLNVNSLGAVAIVTSVGTALVTGDIVANQVVEVIYNSTGPVFELVNPASMVILATTYTNGTTTKNAADASAVQNIAHGLGKIPKKIRIRAIVDTSDGSGDRNSREANTAYNGTTQSSVSFYQGNGQAVIIDTTFTLNIASSGGVTTTTTGVITFDATNIIITWTKTGSPTGTYTLLWEAEG